MSSLLGKGIQQAPETVLRACKVPWMISPSQSDVTLVHTETDTKPECFVVFAGGRLMANDLIDMRRIELTFIECWFARVCPKPDNVGVEQLGFVTCDDDRAIAGADYLRWLPVEWRRRGYCPRSGFYLATKSPWVNSLPDYYNGLHHYVVAGRDGYVELLARTYAWREWLWVAGLREEAAKSDEIAHGEASD